jgi:hypothetical protein
MSIDPSSGEVSGVPTNSDVNTTTGVEVRVNDGNVTVTLATFNIEVTNVNDAPVLADISDVTIQEDGVATIALDTNDTDVGATHFYRVETNSTEVLTEVVDDNLTITPNENFNGSVSVSVTTSDGELTDTKSFILNITPVNDAPVAHSGTVRVIKDQLYSGTLEASDVDLGDLLSYSIENSSYANGDINITNINTGEFTYMPSSGFEGEGNFTFSVTDLNGTVSGIATMSINVSSREINVTAQDDNLTISEDTEALIDVLSNDISTFSDDGSSATGSVIKQIGTPSYGVVKIVDGKVKYQPNKDYYGFDSFTYMVETLSGSQDSATVNVNVLQADDSTSDVLDGLDNFDFSVDDVESKLGEIKNTLSNSLDSDKTAKVALALLELAEISNSTEVGEIVNISANGLSNNYNDYLPIIIQGLKSSDSNLTANLIDTVTDLSGTSTTVLHNISLKLVDISSRLDEAFEDEDYIFEYDDLNITANKAKFISAGVLAAASQLEFLAAYHYVDIDALKEQTISIGNDVVEYRQIDSDPRTIFNNTSLFTISDSTRLSDAQALLVRSIDKMSQFNTSEIEDLEDRADLDELKSNLVDINSSLNGGNNFIIESDEDNGEVRKLYLDLSAIYNPSTAITLSSILGNEFDYKFNDHISRWSDEQNRTVSYYLDDYNSTLSKLYNKPTGQLKNDLGETVSFDILYEEIPEFGLEPRSIPMSANSNLDDIVTKIERVQGGNLAHSYTGDDVIKYIFGEVDLDSNEGGNYFQSAEDVNITYTIKEDLFGSLAPYSCELVEYSSGLSVELVDNRCIITAQSGTRGQGWYELMVSNKYGNTEHRGGSFYIEVPSPTVELSTNSVVLNANDTEVITFTTQNTNSVALYNQPDFITLDGNTIDIAPTSSHVGYYYFNLVAYGDDNRENWYYINISVNPEGSNTSPQVYLSQSSVDMTSGESRSVIVHASDSDGDDLNITLENNPSFVTIVDNNITISPTQSDEGYKDSVKVVVSDGNTTVETYLYIEVREPEVEVEFYRSVQSGSYDANSTSTLDTAKTYYELEFRTYGGLEIDKVDFNTTHISFYEMNDDGSWRLDEVEDYTESDGEYIVNSGKFRVKQSGEFNATELNTMAKSNIFSGGDIGYRMMYKVLEDTYEFWGEYHMKYDSDGNKTHFSSIDEFISYSSANHWFSGNSSRGIAFAEGSTGDSGTLVIIGHSGVIEDYNAGSWEIRSVNNEDILVILPNDLTNYYKSIFKMDSTGLLRGEFEEVDDEGEFIWFNESAKDNFISYINSSYGGGSGQTTLQEYLKGQTFYVVQEDITVHLTVTYANDDSYSRMITFNSFGHNDQNSTQIYSVVDDNTISVNGGDFNVTIVDKDVDGQFNRIQVTFGDDTVKERRAYFDRHYAEEFLSGGSVNTSPQVYLSQSSVDMTSGESRSVIVHASDSDGDDLNITLENNPSFVTIVDNNITISPTQSDEGYKDSVKVVVSDGNTTVETYLYIEVREPEVEVEFYRSVQSGSYDANSTSTLDTAKTYYELEFRTYGGLEIDKVDFNTTHISFYEMNDDGSWRLDEVEDYTESDGEYIVNSGKFRVKQSGEFNATELNTMAKSNIFSGGDIGYRMMYKVLEDTYEFWGEYHMKYDSDGNKTHFSSIDEFISYSSANHWFSGNSSRGIAFAEGSTGDSGTLVIIGHSGVIEDYNAGSWEIRSVNNEDILVILPNDLTNYYKSIFKMDSTGLLRGEFEEVDDEGEFIWFNESAKDNFISYINSSYGGGSGQTTLQEYLKGQTFYVVQEDITVHLTVTYANDDSYSRMITFNSFGHNDQNSTQIYSVVDDNTISVNGGDFNVTIVDKDVNGEFNRIQVIFRDGTVKERRAYFNLNNAQQYLDGGGSTSYTPFIFGDINGSTVYNVYYEDSNQSWSSATFSFSESNITAASGLVDTITNPILDTNYTITSEGYLNFYLTDEQEDAWLKLVNQADSELYYELCWRSSKSEVESCQEAADEEYLFGSKEAAQEFLDQKLGQGE